MIVTPKGEVKRILLPHPDAPDGLTARQEAVGGNIEGFTERDCFLYLDEEGKINGRDWNPVMSAFASHALAPDDFIVGDVLVVGPIDELGGESDVPDHVVEIIESLAAKPR